MKNLLILSVLFFLVLNSYSQVGINTSNPRGVFHIDGNGDNASTPTVAQLKNDLIAQVDANGEMYVNMGSEGHTSSQFGLYDTNKALGLNRVALTSTTDITTVPSPGKGLFVYDTNTNYMHYYSGYMWLRIEDTPYENTSVRTNNLLERAYSLPHTPTGIAEGTLLKFTSTGTITIDEKGSYGFSIRLYGGPGTFTPTPANKTYYVYMTKAGSTSILDCIQIDLYVYTGRPISYTATFYADLEANDEVCFYWAHDQATTTTCYLVHSTEGAINSNRASMLYWKF
ncbi:hypothetical protein [Dysgonomonas macrotermitis]|uniref:Uncharacterized protein n=1 Tax=Dysgonomonas macrotermitis TaxID=1346286 RepID=A0A1M4ZKW4_9BACT|nr:hypothetical protein [Dysgonomonas macrotermitis]SHF18710.1 hypothetical protein SAMN05444362_104121 [Dysgonomonas macrotermitis]